MLILAVMHDHDLWCNDFISIDNIGHKCFTNRLILKCKKPIYLKYH